MSLTKNRPAELQPWADSQAQADRARRRAGAAMKRKARLDAALRNTHARPDRSR